MSDLILIAALALVALPPALVSGWMLYRQHKLIQHMTQLLAARSLGEWASAQKMIDRPKKEPVAEGSNW